MAESLGLSHTDRYTILVINWVNQAAMIAGILFALFIFGLQAMVWFAYGEWPNATVGTGLAAIHIAPPETEWVGIQKIIDWLISWPETVGILFWSQMVTGIVNLWLRAWRYGALTDAQRLGLDSAD